MNDQISRQRLIEELAECTMVGIDRSGSGLEWEDYVKFNTVVELIKSQPPADQWIPCSERLPQDEQDVLGTTDEGIVKKVWYNKYSKTWYGSPFTRRETVIAWMPLPVPYKGE